MLYERWREVVAAHRRETAVWEVAAGRTWTFEALAQAAEGLPAPGRRWVHPCGHTLEFLLEALRGWKAGTVVCPLEPGQSAPDHLALPDAIAHLKTTSATTRAARCVAFTGAQLAADARQIVADMGLRPDWPNLAAISLAHSYGFSNLVLPLFLHGIPLILCPLPLPEVVRAAARVASAVTLPGVPALWRVWHEAGAIPPQVRLAISAGAPLPLSLEQAVFAASGLKIHNFYGASECGGIAYDATLEPRAEESGVGMAMSGAWLEVDGVTGCLRVRGEAVGTSYWPEPDAVLGQGSFLTSDLAAIEGGWVRLRGRVSDLINVAGRKVSPESIERVLGRHPAVAACLVFGAPSPEPGRVEDVVAAVAARTPVEPAELRRWLLGELPAWQVPRAWWFVEELAANARGKMSRSAWREQYLRRERDQAG